MDATKTDVDKALAQLLEKALQGADFLEGQIPLVVQELITYGRVWNSAGVFLGLIGVLVGIWVCKNKPGRMYAEFESTLVGLLVGTVSAMTLAFSFKYMILAWFAPRLYVISHIKELL